MHAGDVACPLQLKDPHVAALQPLSQQGVVDPVDPVPRVEQQPLERRIVGLREVELVEERLVSSVDERVWQEPDEGIWEVRGPRRHFVHSKVSCWVALDRAVRMARARRLPAPAGRWTAERDAIADLLSYLPANCLEDPPRFPSDDPVSRPSHTAARAVPTRPTASYDVREVVADVLDGESFLEVRAAWAQNLVTGFGRLGGRPVGIVANQPSVLAGCVDVRASQKAARFVQSCDAFNLPLVTFVDTPGFQPGKELEWRGMIRHGAQLVHSYAEATIPRLCVVLRKAYGGAYIVMDSRGLGNDVCVAWPSQKPEKENEIATASPAQIGAPRCRASARLLPPSRCVHRYAMPSRASRTIRGRPRPRR